MNNNKYETEINRRNTFKVLFLMVKIEILKSVSTVPISCS